MTISPLYKFIKQFYKVVRTDLLFPSKYVYEHFLQSIIKKHLAYNDAQEENWFREFNIVDAFEEENFIAYRVFICNFLVHNSLDKFLPYEFMKG